MSLSTRDFFIGLVTGVVLTLVIIGALFGGLMYFTMKIAREFEMKEPPLPSLEFPEEGRRTVYGQVDWNWEFKTLDGEELRLSDFEGKALFINYWATWCAPCVAEMPSIQRLHERLPQESVAFLILSDEDADRVKKFLQEKKLKLPVYVYSGEAPPAMYRPGVPATFIATPDGAIVYKHVGAGSWDSGSCEKFIRGLIAELKQPNKPRAP